MREALKVDPYDASAWDWLGRALLSPPGASAQAAREAVFSFRRAVELRPGHAPHLYDLALGLSRTGHADEARVHAEAVVRAAPAMLEARVLLAGLYAQGRAFPEALREYRQAILLRPDLGQLRLEAATVLVAQGDIRGAIDELRIAAADGDREVAAKAAQAMRQLSTGR